MSISINKVVNVTVLTTPTFPQGVGFGLLAIIGSSNYLPAGDSIRVYSDLNGVAGDFPSASEEYAAASIFFQQSPRASTLAIGRRFAVAIAAELLSSVYVPGATANGYGEGTYGSGQFGGSVGVMPTTSIAVWNAITTASGAPGGSLSIVVDGTPENITGLNFANAANMNAVAAIIQTSLAAAKAGSTVVWSGTRFIIKSGTTGVNSTLAYATAAPTGADIAPLMGVRAVDKGIITAGQAAETITAALTRLAGSSVNFFGLAFTREITDQNILDAAAWAEGNSRIFAFTTAESNVQDGSSTTDIVSQLGALEYSFTFAQYDPYDPYAAISAVARAFSVDFTAPLSTITLMFKLEPGIIPLNLTETQREVLEAKFCNYYTLFGTSAMLARGTMVNGRYFDEVHGLEWLKAFIENNVFGNLYTQPTKVPQTDRGMARIKQWINDALQQGVVNGLLAPGIWNGAPIGTISTGDILPKGYYTYIAPVASQTQGQRDSRIAPPATVLATGAGAIQGVNITLNFQQ